MVRSSLIIILIIYPIFADETITLKNDSTKGDVCVKDDNCSYLNICMNSKCEHKPFFPPTWTELTGAFAIIIGSAVSNAGGIGGGGLLIPILILILKFSTHEAIPISKLMILTGASTAFIMGLSNKHPTRNGIPLDLNIAGVLIPMLLFGTMVGVSLNKVTPPSVILISLTLVLVVNTIKTLIKGLNLFKKENDEIKNKKIKEDKEEFQSLKSSYEDTEDNSCNKLKEESDSEIRTSFIREEYENPTGYELLIHEYEVDKINFPSDKIKLILVAYISLLVISLFKGSDHVESLINIKLCSSTYWIMYFLYLPIAILITFIYSEKVLTQYRYRISINYPFKEADVKWSREIILKYPLYSFFGGMMAGLLGIGGGLIFGPLLLELGLHPIVSTATSNLLVLFTSSSTSVQFILLGTMNFKYGLMCTVISTLGSYVGTLAIQRLIDRTGRASALIFSMALVEAVSSVCIPLHAFFEIKKDLERGVNIWNFNSPC